MSLLFNRITRLTTLIALMVGVGIPLVFPVQRSYACVPFDEIQSCTIHKDYSRPVFLRDRSALNIGLTPATPEFLKYLLGIPGKLTETCSDVTNPTLKALMVTENVGPESVTGLRPAVEAVRRIFEAVQRDKPDLYDQLQGQDIQLNGNAMLCVRSVLGLHPADYSTHSWGIAIDVAIHAQLNPVGMSTVQLGLEELYPYFHAEGFYWGAAFLPNADPMHFEVSREQLLRWKAAGKLTAS